MLIPARTKYRKLQKGRNRGMATRGCNLSYGQFGLQALSRGTLTNRQIEAARIAMTRFIKRGGKIWIRIFPDRPVTKKPLETRMGKGKGPVEGWAVHIKPGRMLYEMEGLTKAIALEAFHLAAPKLPVKTTIVTRDAYHDA